MNNIKSIITKHNAHCIIIGTANHRIYTETDNCNCDNNSLPTTETMYDQQHYLQKPQSQRTTRTTLNTTLV